MGMVEVKALVPEDRVGRFYALVSQLVDEREPTESNPAAGGVRTEPWREGDEAIAREVVDANNSSNARRFLRFLAERAGQAVPYTLIDNLLGMTWNQRCGVQGAIGRTAAKRGRDKPWIPDYGAQTATMEPTVAQMFLRALGDRGR